MPQIIVHAHTPDGTLAALTLAERAVPTAEQIEASTNSSHPDGPTRAKTHLSNRSDARTPSLTKHQPGRTPRLAEAEVSR